MPTDSQGKAHRRAEKLARDPRLADRVAALAADRAERFRGRLGEGLDDVRTLTRMVHAWATGGYRQVPVASIVAALGALVYFLMPLDAVPDFIAALGFLDDMAVISRVVHYIRGDLRRFRDWEAAQRNEDERGTGHGDNHRAT